MEGYFFFFFQDTLVWERERGQYTEVERTRNNMQFTIVGHVGQLGGGLFLSTWAHQTLHPALLF